MRRIDELSDNDLHDMPDFVYCRDCKNFDSESNVCMLDDEAEVIDPDKALDFCIEYEDAD